jgi:citrate lyase subunit beta / citryl-CoA lyase
VRRARRSCLSVPATRPRFQEKADGSAADLVILDLEDSVAPSAKESGREGVVAALRTHPYRGKVRSVRVNPLDTPWCLDDILHVVQGAGDRIDTIFLPKAEDAAGIHFVHHLLGQLEVRLHLERRIGLDVQIESARGLERVSEIAAASDRIAAYQGDVWHFTMSRILLAARAGGLQAIDGPYARFRDAEGLTRIAASVAALGYDGKWAIHPDQIEILNRAFAPTQDEFDKASRILSAYRRATEDEGVGAVEVEGEMIDEASRKMADVTVERGRSAGMEPSPD